MTFGGRFPRAEGLRSLEELLRRRWVQVLLFAAVFLFTWCAGSRTAHATTPQARAHFEDFSN